MCDSPSSPAGPKIPAFFTADDGRLPLQLTLTNQKGGNTSVLKTGARRAPHSALKDTSTKLNFGGAVNHFSLFEKVEQAEKENNGLKQQLLACKGELQEALEKAREAEATARAAAAANGSLDQQGITEHAAEDPSTLSKPQLLERLQAMQQELVCVQQERRQAVNQLVEMKGAIRVYCRVRPPSPGNPASCLRVLPDGASLGVTCNSQESLFNFNRVFGPGASQQGVYQEVAELVQSALDGYHVCILSYGQTGSGKTHNMVGSQSPDGQGLIPRAIDKIMGAMRRLGLQGWDYKLELCCVEVYNNSVRDLLDPKAQDIKDMNAIKHDLQGGHTIIQGVERIELQSASQAHQLLQRAMQARACNATAMNSTSSRSHSAFMLNISGTHADSNTQLRGALCLVDLAGSERLDRSQAVGARKAEACAINTSLSSVGDVFEALSTKQKHVPFRNSKLTYLLKPCLSPGGKVLMMVHVQPEPASAHESLTSLRFATKVGGTELGAASKRAMVGGVAPQQVPQQLSPAPMNTQFGGASQGAVNNAQYGGASEAGPSSRRPGTAGPVLQQQPQLSPPPTTTTTSFAQLQQDAAARIGGSSGGYGNAHERGVARRVGGVNTRDALNAKGVSMGVNVRGSSSSNGSTGSGAERGVFVARAIGQASPSKDASIFAGSHAQGQGFTRSIGQPLPAKDVARRLEQQGSGGLPLLGLQQHQHLAPSAQMQLLQSVQLQGANHRYSQSPSAFQSPMPQQQQQHGDPADCTTPTASLRFDPATNRCEGGDTEMEEISGVDLRSALRMKRMQQLQPIGEVQGECTPGDSAKRRKAERKGAWH